MCVRAPVTAVMAMVLAAAPMRIGAGIAVAQPAPDSATETVEATQAEALFARGRDLKKAGQLTAACEVFQQSYQLEPAPGTGLNLADCFEQQGQPRRAWELFDRIAHDPRHSASHTQLARQRAAAVMAKLGAVVVALRDAGPAGLVVRVGDRALSPEPDRRTFRAVVEPGAHELVVAAPGRTAFASVIRAIAGATTTVDVPALRDPAALRRRRLRIAAAGVGTVGVGSLGVSLGFALAARDANREAFDRGCAHTAAGAVCMTMTGGVNQGRRLIHLAGARADLATGFAVGGALLVGAAATIFLTSRETRVAPVAAAGTLGLGIVGRF